MITSFALASVCAILNTASAVCMGLGIVAIKQRRKARHQALMIGAFAASVLFLTVYLTRIALFGDARFGGHGALRAFYLVLLASHVLLAVSVAPLVITTLSLAFKARFDAHRRLARVTFPIWAYVSITGVIVYAMLYHLPR